MFRALMLFLLCLGDAAAGAPVASRVPSPVIIAPLPAAPVLDGAASDHEYGAAALRLPTAMGEVRVWLGRHSGFTYLAAALPDSTYYWGDDFVVSLDPDGSGGTSPGDGDRQWYLRRSLDSTVVAVAQNGRWQTPGIEPPKLGPARHHADWDVASTSSPAGWVVELRIRDAILKSGPAAPRFALRTYNDRPQGWWSWPPPPDGTPAQRVERIPGVWVPLATRPPGDGDHERHGALTRTQAMQLAVLLANEKCQATFHRAPFDSTRGRLARTGGYWRWGALDLGSADGLSAEVRFDARGEDRSVEVFFSTDRPRMLYRPQ